MMDEADMVGTTDVDVVKILIIADIIVSPSFKTLLSDFLRTHIQTNKHSRFYLYRYIRGIS